MARTKWIMIAALTLLGAALPACGDDTQDTTGATTAAGPSSSSSSSSSTGQGGNGGQGQGGEGGSGAVCGDGTRDISEACDDGNTADGDGCDAMCSVEAGFDCTPASPSVCSTLCGDGLLVGGEACDDGNATPGDGCDDACAIESGYSCTGEPSVCTTGCGDGIIAGAEECDDGGTTAGDGCDDTCAIENGYTCTGMPSVCAAVCGDGITAGTEECDDGDTTPGDGCDGACVVEAGYTCVGAPSVCDTTCGDGIIAGAEACDDGDATGGDGCGATCAVEAGYTCVGEPSVCNTTCGDGIIVGAEACDDGDATGGDGCSAACTVEAGYTCVGAPSVCNTTCGDGIIAGAEGCDDGDATGGDGCSAACAVEAGYICLGTPSVCNTKCGDGLIVGAETCDDLNTTSGDGCSAVCAVEAGYNCVGMPSVCTSTCGNGAPNGGEQCDDGNTTSGDGCSSSCVIEPGYTCVGIPSVCTNPCGDGNLDPGEQCDDGNTTAGDGCSPVCAFESVCGNGNVEPGETCDDGGVVAGDGCGVTCQLEAGTTCGDAVNLNTAGTVVGNMTTYGGTNVGSPLTVYGDPSCSTGTLTFPRVLHKYTTTVRSKLKIQSLNVGGALDDTVVWGYLDCQDTAAEFTCDDDSSPDGLYSLVTTNTVPAGTTVFIVVAGYAVADLGAYSLQVSQIEVLANGDPCNPADTSQICDVGLSCKGPVGSQTCQPPVCGDGIIEAGEQCEDGNTANGDGCSSTCLFEFIAEVEPNGTQAEADANAVQIAGSARISGAIGVVNDQDIFKLTLAAASVVRFETFDSSAGSCAGGMTTTLTLFNSTFTQIYTDNTTGINSCSALVVNLAAGTYYVRVQETGNNATIAAYVLEAKIQANGGNEIEVNDTLAQANALAGTNVFIFGGHQVNVDSDYFAVTVPAGASIRAETLEGGAETCEALGVDSRLTLYNPAGVQLADDDDAGRGYCSLIDGTGATGAVVPAAHNLPAGTYYLQVRASTFSQANADGQFDYRLQVTIRNP